MDLSMSDTSSTFVSFIVPTSSLWEQDSNDFVHAAQKVANRADLWLKGPLQ
jgi:hypothetical protein